MEVDRQDGRDGLLGEGWRLGLTVSYFFLSLAKYKTVRNSFTVSPSFDRFAKLKIIRKYDKMCFELFHETDQNILFRSFAYFQLNFVSSL